MPSEHSQHEHIALQFAEALAQRNYAHAYELTFQEYKQQIGNHQMQALFEGSVPLDWGPVRTFLVGTMLTDWPDKQPEDVEWVYVSLEGDVYPYSEGLFILVAEENGSLKIRDVNYGRP